MKNQLIALVLAFVAVLSLSSRAHAAHCAELAPQVAAQMFTDDLLAKGVDAQVQAIVGSYTSKETVVLINLGTTGAFAYKVKTHYVGSTCVIDSVKPTIFTVTRRLRNLGL